MGIPCGSAGEGPGIVTAVVQVRSLAWELLHATGTAKKKKKKRIKSFKKKKKNQKQYNN